MAYNETGKKMHIEVQKHLANPLQYTVLARKNARFPESAGF